MIGPYIYKEMKTRKKIIKKIKLKKNVPSSDAELQRFEVKVIIFHIILFVCSIPYQSSIQ